MKTFYIPTSSLNTTNIISSESISPKSFYYQRHWGMRRFVDIYNGLMDNVIVLFDSLKSFTRPISDVEDHPLVIRLDVDEEVQSKFISINNGAYAFQETLYITPFNTEFIFFTEQDKRVALSLSDHSAEAKLMNLYKKCFCVHSPTESYTFPSGANLQNLNLQKSIAYDSRANKMKGCLYGYYIGAMLSVSPTDVKRLNLLNEVQAIFSSILSSSYREATSEQTATLRRLSMEWQELDEFHQELLRLTNWDREMTSKIECLYKEKKGVSSSNNLGITNVLPWLKEPQIEGTTNKGVEWIERKISEQHGKMSCSSNLLKTDASTIIMDEQGLAGMEGCGDSLELVKNWLNQLLMTDRFIGVEQAEKYAIADTITDITKEHLDHDWGDSKERAFLNKLRKHIKGEAFDVEWGNDALSSLAAVVLHGGEWDELLRFMQGKGMYDYRVAFALYGAITGYANLTRDFTDMFYEKDMEYGKSVYKEFYGQIFGKDISELPVEATHPQASSCENPNAICTLPQKEIYVPNTKVAEIVVKLKESNNYKPQFEDGIRMIEQNSIIEIEKIRDLSFKGCKGWKGFVDSVYGKKKNSKSNSDAIAPTLPFGNNALMDRQDIKSIIYDQSAINHVRNCPNLAEDIRYQVVALFEDFQKSYQSGYYFQHADKYRRNNGDVIDHFQKWCLSEKNKKQLPKTPTNSGMMDELKKYLLEIYPDNK